MSPALRTPLSETNSTSRGISALSRRLLSGSTEKSFRLRLFTPMIRAPAWRAVSASASLWTSTSAVDGEQMHVLRGPAVGDKSDQPPIAVFRWGESGLLVHFPEHAVLGALPVLELAADADPLALIQIILLLDPVEHQTLTALTDVAEGGVDHGRIPPFHNSAALSIARREEGRKGGAYPGRDMQRRGKGLPCSSVSVRLRT